MKKRRHKKENNSSSGHSTEGPKQNVFKSYIKEMEDKTEEFIKKNPEHSDTKFYLFQTIQNKDLVRDMIFNLAYFYDANYIGNKDFIHIPNISNILDNILKYSNNDIIQDSLLQLKQRGRKGNTLENFINSILYGCKFKSNI